MLGITKGAELEELDSAIMNWCEPKKSSYTTKTNWKKFVFLLHNSTSVSFTIYRTYTTVHS